MDSSANCLSGEQKSPTSRHEIHALLTIFMPTAS